MLNANINWMSSRHCFSGSIKVFSDGGSEVNDIELNEVGEAKD